MIVDWFPFGQHMFQLIRMFVVGGTSVSFDYTVRHRTHDVYDNPLGIIWGLTRGTPNPHLIPNGERLLYFGSLLLHFSLALFDLERGSVN